jgi:lipopolysaccharide export LptBFGC system permease protein LptF
LRRYWVLPILGTSLPRMGVAFFFGSTPAPASLLRRMS